MLCFTRKTDYALVALAELALADGGGQDRGCLSARALSDRSHLPLPVLRNLLKTLSRGGLLESVQGSGGGYRLCRDASEISVLEVIELVDGPARLARCCDPSDQSRTAGQAGQAGGESERPNESQNEGCACSFEGTCPIRAGIRGLHDAVLRPLRMATIADLASAASFQNPAPTQARAEPQHPQAPCGRSCACQSVGDARAVRGS